MHLDYPETFEIFARVIERFFLLICRVVLALILISITLYAILHMVIPAAVKIIPHVENFLVSLILKIFGA
jgi:hypothetical protein